MSEIFEIIMVFADLLIYIRNKRIDKVNGL